MKKFTSLLMLFCMSIGMAWAGPTDLPEMSTADNIKYYTISNTRSTSGKYLYWSEDGVKDANTLKLSSLFYFTGTPEECYIHNAATNLLFTGAGAWNSTGVKCEISVTPYGDGTTGLAIKFSGTALNEANTNNGYTTWGAADEGSVFVMEVANVAQMATDYKTAANSALDMISFLGVDEAKATIANLGANINTFAAVDAAVNGVAEYVAFRNGETNTGSVRYNNYLAAYMPNSKGHGAATFNWLTAVWSLKYSGEGSFYIFNVNEELYLGNPGSRGALTQTPNSAYTFEVIEDNKVEFKCGGQTLHMNNNNGNGAVASGNALTSYDEDDVASRWYVETDFSAHVATYKTTALTTLDSWKNLSVVFDGAPIDETKAAIETIATTNYATFAAIDAELKKVTDAVAAKMFTFQCTDKSDAKRVNVYVAANASTGKAVGADNQDYNAIWTLQYAGGTSFYLYNELNKLYLGAPVNSSDAVVLTETPVAAYTFELIENNVVEMKCNGGTLHASNHDDDKLINYDGNEAASRWYVATIDIAADIQAILDGLTSEDYAETPALGQYPTSAYNALVAAKNTAKTVEEVEAAIAAFHASLNAPVYIISGVQDYANGKAIYYNGSDPEWRWDTKNAYNKAMWFRVLGLTTPEFALDTEYNVVDMSGRNIYNKASIKFETVENRDDVYCLKYGTGDSDYLHLANYSNNLVTNWYRATIKDDGTLDSGASAFNVVYIGNSYDLAQLSDELFTAAAELAAVNVPNFSFAVGINNYNEATKPALDDAIANRTVVLGKLSTAEEIADAKEALETAIAGVQLNMPVDGKFYRVRCTASGMKYLQYTQNTNANRFDMISGDDGKTVNATFCYTNGGLVSYVKPLYINHDSNIASMKMEKTTVTFSEATGVTGQYFVNVGGRYLYGDGDNSDSGSGTNANAGYRWWLEEVTSLPVTISAAGYATFYCPAAVTLPEGLTAYYVSNTANGWATLTEIEGTIPANTGVLLAGEAKTYSLTIVEDVDEITGNMLEGTVASTYVTDNSYVLSKQNEVVGFYLAAKNQQENTSFLNNGFKAYLPADDAAEASVLRFNFGGGETAIESVESAEDAKNAVIFDLAGRRVQNAQKGLYIVNGKKVIR